MPYEVLPPLAFFVSLGGIILVVSRVMVRLRREQYANSVQAAVAHVQSHRSAGLKDLAQIIGPSRKSVHVIKNRLTLLKSTARSSAGTLLSRAHSVAGKANTLKRSLLRRQPAPVAQAPDKPKLTIVETPPPAPTPEKKKLFSRPKKLPALQRARAAIEASQLDQAEEILVPYIARHPKNTQAYILLAHVASLQNNWTEALEILQQVVKINPATRGAWAELGRAAYEAGKFTLAIEALQRAHSAEPGNADTVQRLLNIAQRMDNTPMQRSLAAELKALKQNAS